jgi:hypothetical protein
VLTQIDRLQMVVPDAASAAEGWMRLLGAEPEGEAPLRCLAARRVFYRLGTGFVEFLEPDGAGPVADALSQRGAHLFSIGAATPDLAALAARLEQQGASPERESGQLHLGPEATGGRGFRIVVSSEAERPRVGAIDTFYEVTHLVDDAEAATAHAARLFGLDSRAFVPIESEQYGYAGSLTLFHPERLHRFEVIHPHDRQKTMGRFHERFGESLYMAFAETDATADIEERARAVGAGMTPDVPADQRPGHGPDTLFLHPSALGGMMLGLSRRSFAWSWSGSPDRVEPR